MLWQHVTVLDLDREDNTMQIVKYYETTLLDKESDLSAKFIVIPRAACNGLIFWDMIRPDKEIIIGAAESLGLQIGPEIGRGYLLKAITFCLSGMTADRIFNCWPHFDVSDSLGSVCNRHYEFSEYLAMSKVIPLESSLTGTESFGSIITASSNAVGTYIGFVTADGFPLIFATVPVGIIIFGASSSFARGFEERLCEKIKALLLRK